MSLETDPHPQSQVQTDSFWSRLRMLFVAAPTYPLIFPSADAARQAVTDLDDSHILILIKTETGFAYHNRYEPNRPLFDMGDPWGVAAEVEGEITKRHHHKKNKLTVFGDNSIPDDTTADLCIKVMDGVLTLSDRDQDGTWTLDATLNAPWLTADPAEFLTYLEAFRWDLNQQGRYLSDTEGTRSFQGFGRYISRLRQQTTGRPTPSRGRKPLEVKDKLDFPKGATDCVTEDDGTLAFTSSDEFGTPARYRLDRAGNWRAQVDETIIIMHFGQSNAGVNEGGGEIPNAIRLHSHVVNLNDGYGVRGLLGRYPKFEATALTPFDQNVDASIQSVVGVAAGIYLEGRRDAGLAPRQVAVRSEAKGGQAFIGRVGDGLRPGIHRRGEGDYSPSFLNLIASLRKMIELAAQEGAPVKHIYIPFTHQEANRQDSIETYCTEAMNLFNDVEDHIRDLDVPVAWLLDQAPGSTAVGAGSHWNARLALHELSRRAPNIEFIQPRYPYPMFDKSHWSNVGKALYGEFLGHIILELEKGKPVHAAELVGHEQRDRQVVLRFNNLTPLVFDLDHHPVINSVKGFTLEHASGIQIDSAKVTGTQEVTLSTSAPLPSGARICYSFRPRTQDEYEDPIDWAVGAGGLRETWSRPCKFDPSETLYRWVPAFRVEIA